MAKTTDDTIRPPAAPDISLVVAALGDLVEQALVCGSNPSPENREAVKARIATTAELICEEMQAGAIKIGFEAVRKVRAEDAAKAAQKAGGDDNADG